MPPSNPDGPDAPPRRPVMLVSDIFPPKVGGSGRWFWEIYSRLSRADYLIAAGEHPSQEDFDRTHDLRVFRVPLELRRRDVRSFASLCGYWRAIRRLSHLATEQGVGMLHCSRYLSEGLMGLALKCRRGLPYACYVHGEEINIATTSRELTWLARRVLSGAEFLIGNSRNTCQLLVNEWGLSESSVRLLHPGVDTHRFRPAAPDDWVRDRLGWRGRRVILTVGRLQQRKGQDHMILALNRVRQRIPEVLFAIVGAGEDLGRLQSLVANECLADHVQFLGEVKDEELVECYQQCDLFVLANREVGKDIEGFGMVLLEAQSCGKPVVAGRSGGTAETMAVPHTGRLVSCDNVEELAAVVAGLLIDRQQLARMGECGRRRVLEHFDWGPLSRQAEQIFAGNSPHQV